MQYGAVTRKVITESIFMKAEVENYKGIEFVRISKLPDDQKRLIRTSFEGQKIIKILYNKELLSDCLKYSDYVDWYTSHFRMTVPDEPLRAKELRLAFK